MSNKPGFINQICTICRQSNLEQIENDRLNNRLSYQKMEDKYNLNHSTLSRHFSKCIKERVDVDARVSLLLKEQRENKKKLLANKAESVFKRLPPVNTDEIKQSFDLTLSQMELIEKYLNEQKQKELQNQGKQLTTVERADKMLNQAEQLMNDCFDNNYSVGERAKSLTVLNDIIKTLSALKGETIDPLKHPVVIALIQVYNSSIAGCSNCSVKAMEGLAQIKR